MNWLNNIREVSMKKILVAALVALMMSMPAMAQPLKHRVPDRVIKKMMKSMPDKDAKIYADQCRGVVTQMALDIVTVAQPSLKKMSKEKQREFSLKLKEFVRIVFAKCIVYAYTYGASQT